MDRERDSPPVAVIVERGGAARILDLVPRMHVCETGARRAEGAPR